MRSKFLISKYLNEGLTPEERFELEKMALDDPLTGDAWEGILSGDQKEVAKVWNKIELRREAQRTPKIIPLHKKIWPYAVAASFALVLSFTFLLQQQNQSANDLASEIALSNEPESSDLNIAMDSEERLEATRKAEMIFEEKEKELIREIEDASALVETNPSARDAFTKVEKKETSNTVKVVERTSAIPNKIPEDDQVALNALTAERLAEMPENEKPVAIPNAAEPAIAASAPASNSDSFNNLKSRVDSVNQAKLKTDIAGAATPKFNKDEIIERPQFEEDLSASLRGKSAKKALVSDQNQQGPRDGVGAFYKKLSENTEVTREELFMYGIKMPYEVTVEFEVDIQGTPINVQVPGVSGSLADKIIDLFPKGGLWKLSGGPFEYRLKVPIKEER